MSSKASQFIILCEDKMHSVFVGRFLKKGWNIPHRIIRSVIAPSGEGSGEQFVTDEYPNQLKAFRSRSAVTVLIAVTDADIKTVNDRNKDLDSSAKNKELEPRGNNERILHIIPKRNIETWLAYLSGKKADEGEDYKSSYGFSGHETDAWPLIDKLVECCKNKGMSEDPPASLRVACSEFDVRLRDIL